ncbi:MULTISPECIES: S53 family peptidase, partial [unclassified Frankia]|uniref:S53 family peptidase n=1 Tax=unclassified Frankia TaxID=2632575 RepID=UPI002AD393D3
MGVRTSSVWRGRFSEEKMNQPVDPWHAAIHPHHLVVPRRDERRGRHRPARHRHRRRAQTGRHRRWSRSRLASVAVLAILALTLPAMWATGAAPSSLRALLHGSLPSWGTADNARDDLPAGQELDLTVNLALRDPADAESFAVAVSDPANARYGRFLTPARFKTAYAATDTTVKTVQSWLTINGFQIVSVSPTNRSIRVHGTAATVKAAFHTTLKLQVYKGKVTQAPSTVLSVPASLTGVILSIGGLTLTNADHTTAPPEPAYVRPPICSRYFGEKHPADSPVTAGLPAAYGTHPPMAVCGYTAQQVRSLYGIDKLTSSGVDGRGRTVAIVGAYASPSILADVNTWAARQHEPLLRPGQFHQYLPPAFGYGYHDPVTGDLCSEQTWYGEQTLDVEAVHGIAPGADISYVAAASCQSTDLIDAVQRVVDGRLADVVSASISFLSDDEPPGDIAAAHATFVQAAAEGIGLYFSAGDDGDNLVHTKVRQVEYPASDPLVTAVGGTTAGISETGSRLFELGWETAAATWTNGAWTPAAPGTFQDGGGGGVSTLFAQPPYQTGIVPPAVATYLGGRPGRAIPDVAMLADPTTGYLVGQTEQFSNGTVRYVEYRLGGTSLATPLFAGIVTLADQLAGRPLGFTNYTLYRMANTPA